MNRIRCLLLLLLALLLSGCVSASGSYGVPALDDYEEHYDDYEYDDVPDDYVAKEEAVNYVWDYCRDEILDLVVDYYSANDLFEGEVEDLIADTYRLGYQDAKDGAAPAYDY